MPALRTLPFNANITAFSFICFLALLTGCSDSPSSEPVGNSQVASNQVNHPSQANKAIYDLVLSGGRVMDPETGLDAIRNLGINGDQIVAISEEPLAGTEEIDLSGLVVAPGFIDLHSHSPTPMGHKYQALDGVTTSLELEAGAFPVTSYGEHFGGKVPLNYGASAGHTMMRIDVKHGVSYSNVLDDTHELSDFGRAFVEPATEAEREQLRDRLYQGLDQGGLGIGLLLDYLSAGIDADELRMVFEVAGERQAPVFVHVRRGLAGDISGLNEVIELALDTGAPLHICHLQHSAMQSTPEFLAAIRAARAQGLDISSGAFPYNAGTTSISAAVFYRDWQSIFGITYGDVEWAATGERFTQEMWEEYQKNDPSGMVIHHYVKEAWTLATVVADDVIVVTDGTPIISPDIKVPPQGIGSYSRILGRYVREQQQLDLMTAIRKMSLMPAQRLEKIAPLFTRKGRIQVGADADISVFDPDKIIDNSTYQEPFQASEGVQYLLVNGQFVVRQGTYLPDSTPGRRLLSTDTITQ